MAELALLRVDVGPISFRVGIGITETLGMSLGYRGQISQELREQVRSAVLLAALPKIRAKLDAMEAPTQSSDTALWMESFDSDDKELLDEVAALKRCGFQTTTPRGLICEASSEGDKLGGRTSRAVCRQCKLPDDRIQCSNLMHPSIVGESTMDGGHDRQPFSAFCDIRTDHFDISLCRPGGHDCWAQRPDPVREVTSIPEDIGERTIEELAFLNLTFKNEVGRGLLRINDPRTTPGLLLGCNTSEDFAFRMATIADIINNFDTGEVTDSEGRKVEGPLNRLQGLLSQRGVLLDEAPIRRLRDLVAIRNGFTHTGNSRVVAAFAGLGMEYPPTSWTDSWQQALFHFWTALRAIRQMITTSESAQENGAGAET